MQESTIFYLSQLVDCWKQLRLDIIGAVMSLFVYIVAASTHGFIPPALLLVAITYTNTLPSLCSNLVSVLSNVETAFNSVERIMHYAEELQPEETVAHIAACAGTTVPSDWPSAGKIEASEIVLGYRDGPDILKRLTFATNEHEKVGVCGRTGSGK